MEAYRALHGRAARRPSFPVPPTCPGRDAPHVARRESVCGLAASATLRSFREREPGSSSCGLREFCRSWPNQQEVTVAGLHFAPEDSPGAIGRALAEWLPKVRARSDPRW